MLWLDYPQPSDLPAPLIGDPSLPLVSIVTPSFNQGRFIEQTITSVLSQDYPNLEYWVIDGGSSDETLAVLRRFAGEPRLHWISERDRGQSDAINKGWVRCQGQVLAWLNSDDTYLPGAVRTMVAALSADAAEGVAYGDIFYTDEAGRRLGRVHSRPYSPLALLRLELPLQPATFLRRAVVARVGPLRQERRYSMDTDYWVRCARFTAFRRVPTPIATYRLHSDSKTVAAHRGFYDDWLAIAANYFADPTLPTELYAARGIVFADIYSAMSNLEAEKGSLPEAMRFLGLALAAGGVRPRMLKLPLSLLERYFGLGLGTPAVQAWSYLSRQGCSQG